MDSVGDGSHVVDSVGDGKYLMYLMLWIVLVWKVFDVSHVVDSVG